MKLLIVDDHAILREGLVVQQFEQGADVLQASDTAEGGAIDLMALST